MTETLCEHCGKAPAALFDLTPEAEVGTWCWLCDTCRDDEILEEVGPAAVADLD